MIWLLLLSLLLYLNNDNRVERNTVLIIGEAIKQQSRHHIVSHYTLAVSVARAVVQSVSGMKQVIITSISGKQYVGMVPNGSSVGIFKCAQNNATYIGEFLVWHAMVCPHISRYLQDGKLHGHGKMTWVSV